MKMFKVHDIYCDEINYMTTEEIENYAEDLADRIEEEDESGKRPTTDTFKDCVNALESVNSYVYELDKIDKKLLNIEVL